MTRILEVRTVQSSVIKILSEALKDLSPDLNLVFTKKEDYIDDETGEKVTSGGVGDTVTIVLFNKLSFEKHKLRMYGYDSPEMKPKRDLPNRDQEISKAKQAKKYLSDIVLNKILKFESMGYDKYGRLLGKLYIVNNCSKQEINQLMIDLGHGYPYYGGTKQTPNNI